MAIKSSDINGIQGEFSKWIHWLQAEFDRT